MKKSASLALTLTLCTLLLSGCGFHVLPFPGLSTFHYEYPEKYTVSGSFSSELACKTEGGRRIFGKGNGDYSIDTTSGSVYIEKK